jgi:hypothetical protein
MSRSDQPDNAALPFALAHDDFGRLVLVDGPEYLTELFLDRF